MLKQKTQRVICRSSSHPIKAHNVLHTINRYNDNILILRYSIKNATSTTESIYDAVYYDQLEELYATIADLKTKMNYIEYPCDDVDAGPCKSFDL